jgi:N-dimethylarginine dimethylaminohydrolase
MKTTYHSEYLKLNTVFIKPAKNAFVSEKVLKEQWRAHNFLDQPDYKTTLVEYDFFRKILQKNGAALYDFPFNKNVSIDSIYCRDASIATNFGMIICNMGKENRINEPSAQLEIFKNNSIPILGIIESPGTLEGGDVAWLDEKTLAVGLTYRTNENGIKQLKKLLEPKGIEVLVAHLPHYKGTSDVFHLMSILSPVARNLAVVYSPLMPIKFRNELIKRKIKLIEVPDEEFESMGCNVLAIAPKECLMVDGNPKTQKALIKAGCKVTNYKGENISVFGGGGPTCLTRPMLREL